jgi:multiple sugar transport system substrate-binding protein
MFRKSHVLVAASALVVGAFSLASCSGGTADPAPTGDVEGDVGYSFWGSPARAEKVNDVIGLFENAYPGASVSPEVAEYVSYVERLTVRAAGGDLACATGIQSAFFAPYANNGALRPLDDLIQSGQIDTSGIPEDVLAAGQVDGVQYMVPTGTFVRLSAYNEGLVRAAGASTPNDDMTWEDWADWLRQLQAGLPEGVYATENEGGTMWTFTAWVIGHGEEMFDDSGLAFDKQLLAEYFEYWIDLAEDGVAIPPASIPAQNGPLELSPLALGTAVTGTRDIPHLYIIENELSSSGTPTTVGSVSIPSESQQSANVLGSNGIAIPENCDDVVTAAAFANFFLNDVDAAVAFQSDNGIVTNTDAQEALLADPATPEGVKRSIETFGSLSETGDLTTTTYPEGLGSLTTELLRLYQSAAFGETSIDAAVDEFFAVADSALN